MALKKCDWCGKYYDPNDGVWRIEYDWQAHSLDHIQGKYKFEKYPRFDLQTTDTQCCSEKCAREAAEAKSAENGADSKSLAAAAAAQAQAAAERKARYEAEYKEELAEYQRKVQEEADRRSAALAEAIERGKARVKEYDEKVKADRKAVLAAERKDCVVIDGIVYSASKTKLLGRADKMEEGDKKAPSGSIVIPDGVTEIVIRAFFGCTTIKSVTIPASVKTIGQEAFKGCTALESITLSEGLEVIGIGAFEGCSALKSITIPSTVRKLNDWIALSGYSAHGKTYAAHGIFADCKSLETAIVKAKVKEIPDAMFCKFENLKAVSLPSSLTKYTDAFNAFTLIPITTVYFPADVNEKALLSAFVIGRSLVEINIVGGSLSPSVKKAFQKAQKRGIVTLNENVPQEQADRVAFNPKYTKDTAMNLIRARSAKEGNKKKLSELLSKLAFVSAPLWFAALHIANGASVTIVPGLVFLAVVVGASYWFIHMEKHFQDFLNPAKSIAVYIAALIVLRLCGVWSGDLLVPAACSFIPTLIISIVILVLQCRNKVIKLGSLILGIASVALPVLIGVVFTLSSPSAGSGSSGKTVSASKAAKSMAKWYTPEADIVVGQQYVPAQPSVNTKTGELEPVEATELFGKDGLAFGQYAYSVDTAAHKITLITKNGFLGFGKQTGRLRYFADGSVVFEPTQLLLKPRANSTFNTRIKQGAAFNAENAREVVGKTFSGKWSDTYDASVTFGNDGTATVKFSDGDTAKGAYLAGAELNAVLYNHKNAGVWYAFTYKDDSDEVRFTRFYVKKYGDGTAYDRLEADRHLDWKKK